MEVRTLIGLSFERPYLMEDLNLMITKSAKSTDFGKIRRFQQKPEIVQISKKTVDLKKKDTDRGFRGFWKTTDFAVFYMERKTKFAE